METTQVAGEDVLQGDQLLMTSDDDPNPQVFRVAQVENVRTTAYLDETRVVLTAEPLSEGREPMVLAYPRGTQLGKVSG